MEQKEPEVYAHSIVLRGNFNVLIFQPLWFSSMELIREREARNAEIGLIHKDIVSFSIDWLKLHATPDKMTFSTIQKSSFELLRDLVIGTFSILEHTPIDMLGINFESHTKMPSSWNWKDYQKKMQGESLLNSFNAGILSSISIENKREYNNIEGSHIIKIEPSRRVKGLFVSTNDHYILDSHEPKNSESAVKTIQEEWQSSYTTSDDYRNIVVKNDE